MGVSVEHASEVALVHFVTEIYSFRFAAVLAAEPVSVWYAWAALTYVETRVEASFCLALSAAFLKAGTAIDDKISIATVYRTVKLFEEAGILIKHDFKAGKARYEINDDHNHLIDINSGEIVEFVDKDIEELQKKIAKKLGYNLVDHKLELYGSKIKK